MKMSERIKKFFQKTFWGFQYYANKNFRASWKMTDYLTAYQSSTYVYACVRKRAEKVGEIDFVLMSGDKEVENHPILNLLYRPNPYQTKNEFFELYQIYKDLAGCAFIYLIRTGVNAVPREMYLLRPDWITVVVDEATGLIGGYKYKLPNGKEQVYASTDVVFTAYPSPLNAIYGQSPLVAGALSVDTEKQLAEYHYNVLKNGGKVEGILSYKVDTMTQEQIDGIKREFAKNYSGTENAGKLLVSYGDSSYQNLGLTPAELSYIESKKMTRDDILLLFGVPKAIVAQTDDVNYSNAKEGKSIFLSETIRPLLENLVTKLDEFLVPEQYELTYIDPTPDDVDLRLKKIESGLKNGYMTINEAREQMDLEAVDNGDEILIPFSLVPLGQEAVNDAPADTTPKSLKKLKHPLQDPMRRKIYGEMYIKKMDRQENLMLRKLKTYFNGQKNRVVEHLSAGVKGLEDEGFNIELEIEIARSMFYPVIEKFAKQAGEEALILTGSDKVFKLSGKIVTTLKKRADLFADSINRTTFEQLQRTFKESFAAGEGRLDLIKRIKDVYGDISMGRAGVIARTETGVATQEGTFEGYKQGNIDLKIWVSTMDDKVRESHYELNGEERPLDMPFSNGLQFPLDPDGAPEEVINCRCTI
jgi:HK97 family phage portal protein